MYQVLYRKYRPKVFADVYGQEHVTSTLKNEIKEGRIAHAYLLQALVVRVKQHVPRFWLRQSIAKTALMASRAMNVKFVRGLITYYL